MSTAITPESYAAKAARLTSTWQRGDGPLRLQKSTISNLFRYQPRGAAARRLSLGEFNHVLGIDNAGRTVEVEGLTTYETVVRYCLEHGLLPLVAPELKHITVGGATVGIGIESTCYRYGFVHDGLREADVLLPMTPKSAGLGTTLTGPGLDPRGATSIGGGILVGSGLINGPGATHPNKALIVLSDGNENTAPTIPSLPAGTINPWSRITKCTSRTGTSGKYLRI